MIGLVGRARAGKDTVADFLVDEFGFHKIAFADKLKDAFSAYHKIPREWCDGVGVDREEQAAFYSLDLEGNGLSPVTIREGLQRFGTELARDNFGKEFWIEQLFRGLPEDKKLVVPDVRFFNEAEAIRAFGRDSLVLGVDRFYENNVKEHSSEFLATRMFSPGVCDYVFNNDGTKNELYNRVRRFIIERVL